MMSFGWDAMSSHRLQCNISEKLNDEDFFLTVQRPELLCKDIALFQALMNHPELLPSSDILNSLSVFVLDCKTSSLSCYNKHCYNNPSSVHKSLEELVSPSNRGQVIWWAASTLSILGAKSNTLANRVRRGYWENWLKQHKQIGNWAKSDERIKGKQPKWPLQIVFEHWVRVKDVFRAWNGTQPWKGHRH